MKEIQFKGVKQTFVKTKETYAKLAMNTATDNKQDQF
jgi:hypothetical protein